MRTRISIVFAAFVAALLPLMGVAGAQDSETPGIDQLVQSFRDATIQGDLVTAGDGTTLSPFGGPSSVPIEEIGKATVEATVEFRANPGSFPGFDAEGTQIATANFGESGTVDTEIIPLHLDQHFIPPVRPGGLDGLIQDFFGPDIATPDAILDGFSSGQPFPVGDALVIPPPGSAVADFGAPVTIRGARTSGVVPVDGCPGEILELFTGDAISGAPTWTPADFAPNDTFGGLSQAHVTRCHDGQWQPTQLLVNQGSGFQPVQTLTTAIVFPEAIFWIIPDHEVAGTQGSRIGAFLTQADNPFQPDTSGFTTVPSYPGLTAPGGAPVFIENPFPGHTLHPVAIDIGEGSNGTSGWMGNYGLAFDPALVNGVETYDTHMIQFDTYQIAMGPMTFDPLSKTYAGILAGEGDTYSEKYDFGTSEYAFDAGDPSTHPMTVESGTDQSFVAEMTAVNDERELQAQVAATTTTPTEAVDTTASTAASTGSTLADGANLESGSFRVFVPIVIVLGGIAIIIGGFWVYYKTRERRRPGTAVGSGPGDDDGPRDTPPPVVYGEVVEHPSCDWSVYFHDGAKWVPLRTPSIASHECCVYRIKVRTKIRGHVQAAKARQDAGDGRLQIPDYDFSWTGLNLEGHTSTRSGPRGRLDWMQGLGDPTEQADLASDDTHWQRAQGEEPPELAVHLEHREITQVEVKLEAGCPEYTNTYKGWGSSTLDVMATQECTNDDPTPECPVELNAFGWSWGEVWGDINYWFGDTTGTDIDELEGAMQVREQLDPEERENATPPHGGHPMWDGHDHVTRDRATYENHVGGTDTQTFEDDRFSAWIVSEYELDSAQLVPVHVWPTTERVTTHIESGLTHAVDIGGSMIPRNCESNGCGGHGECRCTPEFKIKFDAAVTTIEVDGKTHRIHRDPVSADRRNPPASGTYQAWKLV